MKKCHRSCRGISPARESQEEMEYNSNFLIRGHGPYGPWWPSSHKQAFEGLLVLEFLVEPVKNADA